jgi:hypothetical protein
MPAMIVFPSVVQDILASYGDLFANAPERRHFAEYLTGLFIAELWHYLGRPWAPVGEYRLRG